MKFLKKEILNNPTSDPRRVFKRTLTVKFIILGVTTLIAIAGLLYLSGNLSRGVTTLKKLRAENKWLLDNFQVIADVSQNKSLAGTLQKELDLYLPTALQVPIKVVPDLKALMATHKLLNSVIELGKEDRVGDFPVYTISIRGEGAQNDIAAFLGDLEASKVAIHITSYTLTSSLPGRYQVFVSASVFTRAGLL